MIRSYSELIKLKTFDERFNYLKLSGTVGQDKFGFDRYLNQFLYHDSKEWKTIRRKVILRDNGCDLGLEGYDIPDRIIVHHINPITVEDLVKRDPIIFDMDNLISTSHSTHNAIHYGTDTSFDKIPIERSKNDTCPWKRR